MSSLCEQYERLLEEGAKATNSDSRDKILQKIRELILLEGFPLETEKDLKEDLTLRGKIWKVLLGIEKIDAEEYIRLVEKGPTSDQRLANKIQVESTRAFGGDTQFKRKVSPDKLVRVSTAFLHSLPKNSRLTYVQGLNHLIGPFLYNMPEVDAFFCFMKFMTVHCPTYAERHLEGTMAGLMIFDAILAVVDPELSNHLLSHQMPATVYAMTPIQSLNGHVPPFTELLCLWDLYIAFGVHLSLLFVVAQVLLRRDELLATDKLSELLLATKWPHLNAKVIIPLALQILHILPPKLYKLLVEHPYVSVKDSVFYKKNNPSLLVRRPLSNPNLYNTNNDLSKQQQQQQQQQQQSEIDLR
jgi:cell cycle arrest protein BUB2